MGKWGSPRAHVQTSWQEAQRGKENSSASQATSLGQICGLIIPTHNWTALHVLEMPTSLFALHPAGSPHRDSSLCATTRARTRGEPGTKCSDQSESVENEKGGIFFKGGLVSLLSEKGWAQGGTWQKEALPAHHAHPAPPHPYTIPAHMTRGLPGTAERLSFPYPLPHLGFGLLVRVVGRNLYEVCALRFCLLLRSQRPGSGHRQGHHCANG